VLSIRRFGAAITAQQLVEKGAMTEEMLYLLSGCVHARLNIIISGGTGSGKTTLLNALSSFIPNAERVVTIEDAAELRLQQEHVVRLETRPPNSEGRGEVLARDLVKNALRMRPDRIILGECRGPEALDMLQAMNTGHEGSLADHPRQHPARRARPARDAHPVRRHQPAQPRHARADLVGRRPDRPGHPHGRRIAARHEHHRGHVDGGRDRDVAGALPLPPPRRLARRVGVGDFEPTGVRPQFADRLKVAGIELPPTMFTPR
jgi:pilus assembly protein CpaF